MKPASKMFEVGRVRFQGTDIDISASGIIGVPTEQALAIAGRSDALQALGTIEKVKEHWRFRRTPPTSFVSYDFFTVQSRDGCVVDPITTTALADLIEQHVGPKLDAHALVLEEFYALNALKDAASMATSDYYGYLNDRRAQVVEAARLMVDYYLKRHEGASKKVT